MVKIEFKNVSFFKDGLQILSDINLTIGDKEYFTIVGPTGAGKTSLIALIAGIYTPTCGSILFDDRDVTTLAPEDRHCGVMFESYALFPHFTVLDNVSYAKHMKSGDHLDTYSLSTEILRLVRLDGREQALPKECSGGMQQRVALSRAIMALEEGGTLILDEPFKALDAGLRKNLRREVKSIAKSDYLHLTTVHVTNDMQEAMMGDRIAVMNGGKIIQIGTPKEIIYDPVNLFVTNFFSNELNHFSGKIVEIEEVEGKMIRSGLIYKISIDSIKGYSLTAKTAKKFNVGDDVTFLVRSHYFKARRAVREDKSNSLVGVVKRAKFMGAWLRIEMKMRTSDKILKIEVPTTRTALNNFSVGEVITAYYPSEFVIVFSRIPQKVLEDELKVH